MGINVPPSHSFTQKLFTATDIGTTFGTNLYLYATITKSYTVTLI